MEIKHVAVLGSGVMGSGIAALAANAGVKVTLLDIVPNGAEDRNVLAKGGIEKQLKSGTPGFTHPRNAKRIVAGNLEDNLDALADADLIIEAVLEKIEVKQDVYRKIEAVRKEGSVVSSNTSTLPLAVLIQGMPERFQRDFMITHFFNPPRFMRLLEVTPSPTMDRKKYDAVCAFGDRVLGKGVVLCKDTPGFLANRIGVYWMTAGLLDAIRLGIRVEEADAVMGKPLGFPKTGMFGLYDLIGIDLMPLIAKAMLATLLENDAFRTLYSLPPLVEKMIADGYTGRKGKGGFTRINKTADGKKTKEVIDLKTGEYRPEKKAKLESVDTAKAGMAALFSHPDIGGQYAAQVMLKTLHYAASLIPEISDDIFSVDQAMQLGYNWKYGPFAMIDRLAIAGASGTEIFAQQCEKFGLNVPPVIAEARGKKLYDKAGSARTQFNIGGKYTNLPKPEGSLMLDEVKLAQKPIKKNPSAQCWDLGDGILGLELTSKMNTWDPENLKMVQQLPDIVKREGFRGVVVGTDAEHFSFGANIGFFMLACNTASWWAISDMITQGQNAYMGLKYAPFPVVASLSGMALGGGCELLLHCDAVQAHMESYPGLVEAGIGVIPGWGGCKELVWRHMLAGHAAQKAMLSGTRSADGPRESEAAGRTRGSSSGGGTPPTPFIGGGPMPAISKVFEYISMAKVGGSAEEARDMMILNSKSRISMNRARVLADAKSLCLELAENYTPPERVALRLPGASGAVALNMAVANFVASGKATAHDAVVSGALASVITGGGCDITQELHEEDVLKLEHDLFMELVHTQATRDRIAHMLATNKPLRN
jgi:3-hydroxyacyl-CoA dehydrogenase